MMDCKHDSFVSTCLVCWFKIGHGIAVNDSPIRGDEGTAKHTQDCLNMAIGIGKRKLELWETEYGR